MVSAIILALQLFVNQKTIHKCLIMMPGLHILHINVRSVVSKMDMIRIWACLTGPDIIVVSGYPNLYCIKTWQLMDLTFTVQSVTYQKSFW